MSEKTFEQRMTEAVQDALVKLVRDGSFIQPQYQNRITIDPQILREIHNSVSLERVKARVQEGVETRMADAILNAMATEFANDVKQILSQRELREDVRAVIRDRIRQAAKEIQV